MKKIYLYLLVAATAWLSASCAKFFDEEPPYASDAGSYFSDANSLRLYTNKFIDDYSPSAASLTRGDACSDIGVTTQTENFLKPGGYSARQASGWSTSDWAMLHSVNYYLKNMVKAKDNTAPEIYAHYEGVGRFWRAWFYWNKVKMFGDVPWYGEPIAYDDQEQLYKGRDPRAYVMNKVLEDLNYATEHCLADEAYLNKGLINAYVALMLKARICLYEGTWRKYHAADYPALAGDWQNWVRQAADAAKQVMDSGKYKLYNTGHPESDYSAVFKSETPVWSEVIHARVYSSQLSTWHDASWYFASGSYGARNSAPRHFIHMYLKTNGTPVTGTSGYATTAFKDEFDGRDYRLRQTFISKYYRKKVNGEITNDFSLTFPSLESQLTYYRTIKWNTDDAANEGNSSSNNSLSIFRFAETLLIYAEAKAELGEMTTDVWNETIKLLRERAGVTSVYPVTPDAYLQAYYGISDPYLLEIRRERSIEMYLENMRRDDLNRWKCGPLLLHEFEGIYIPALGTAIDLNGDGKNDVCFNTTGTGSEDGVAYIKVGSGSSFRRNAAGNLVYNPGERVWEDYQYLYPVPKTAIDINPNLLPQNPGWN